MKLGKRNKQPSLAETDHGFIRHRRREDAIACVMILDWRFASAGAAWAEDLSGMSNACPPTARETMDEATELMLQNFNRGLGKQRCRHATAQLLTSCKSEEVSLIGTGCGVLMGIPTS